MTIDEAIKILSEYVFEDKPQNVTAFDDATRLGIEALQFFKGAQREAGGYQELHLMGETKD